MRSFSVRFALLLCVAQVSITAFTTAAEPVGLEKRVLWTTSKVVGTPDPPSPFHTELAFPKLTFNEPLALATVPGSKLLYVAERAGKIHAFSSDPASQMKPSLVLDVSRTVYGLVLHPKFAENGLLFISSVLDPKDSTPTGSRVSRFHVDPKTGTADAGKETVILEWPSGGHNGGCLKFGPDGFLYLATGDGSGIADELQTGQNLGDLLGAMLRLDVDHPAEGKNYGIPADNPFVKTAGARPEVFAYGLRQPWKYSFDTATGDLWAGEVGQDLWDMVHLIRKGGNYGWSIKEGTHPFRPERKLGPTPIIPPIVEHNHNDFRSVTGGHVYHGKLLDDLQGAYVYADYDTGRIWSLRYTGGKVSEHRELTDTVLRIVEVGADNDGELLFVDFTGGQIYRLAPTPASKLTPPEFPRRLSETGLFSSTKDHTPAAGLIPYSVNAQLWSDHATKDRFIAIPGDGQIDFDAITYPQPAPGAPPGWRFPDNTVLVKTFSMEMEKGKPETSRRLETRLLHFEQTPGTQEYGDQVWKGYTYIWNDEQTDAVLAPSSGVDRELQVKDASAPDGVRKQTWHFPSRAECSLCHTQSAKFVLGTNTLQMNRDHDYNGKVANQLKTLEHIGLFKSKLPEEPAKLPKLVDYNDEKASLNDRARSYLHSNCAHCHRKWGGGNAEFQLMSTLDLKDTGTINVRPGQGAFGLNDPKLLTPGNPERSMIYHRMSHLGLGHMPHVASTVLHEEAVKLIREWIAEMK